MTDHHIVLKLTQQQLELLDRTVARGVAADRTVLVRTPREARPSADVMARLRYGAETARAGEDDIEATGAGVLRGAALEVTIGAEPLFGSSILIASSGVGMSAT